MNDTKLTITRTYDPADLPELENQFVLREKLSREIGPNRDYLSRYIAEDMYADALQEIEQCHQQIYILREALKVAAAIINLAWLKDTKAAKYFHLTFSLANIAKNSRKAHWWDLENVHKAFKKLCPADVTGRDEWNFLRANIAPRIYKRDQYTCVYCGSRAQLSIDHIIPVSKGGKHDDDNLATCCRSCNSSKGDRTIAEWDAMKRRDNQE